MITVLYKQIAFASLIFALLLSAPSWSQTEIQTLPLTEEQSEIKPEIDAPVEVIVPNSITTVRALDKITAHITELNLPVGEYVGFGTLRIVARTCSSRPPEETPETYAFLEIDDEQRDGEYVRVFTGWMMASSPALNALEHPVYDIWVISCKIIEGDASSDIE